MTATKLTDGRVIHIPGMPFITDSESVIQAPTFAEMLAVVPLIREEELLLFAKRLVDGARKRRFADRYAKINRARLLLARLCIDRALEGGTQSQTCD